jgi:hypothetical protein
METLEFAEASADAAAPAACSAVEIGDLTAPKYPGMQNSRVYTAAAAATV